MYTFRQIRDAVLAGGRGPGFPYEEALAPGRLAELRAAPHLQELLAEVRADARRAQGEPVHALPFGAFKLFEATGSRREYERPYFDRRARLIALTLAAVLDEDDAPIPALEDLVWAICDEYTWCLPAHLGRGAPTPREGYRAPEQVVDLFAAETAHALAEVLALLGPRLHPWIPFRVRAEVERRVFRPLFHDPVHFHWEALPMNWASVCAGAAGMAALLLEENPERLAGMMERCCRAMECFMEGFGPDGGCAEGVGYWQYGFGYYVYFAEMLRDYTGGALDLLAGELARRVAAFPAAVSLGGAAFVNYSDGPDVLHLRPGLLSRLAKRLGAPVPELAARPGLHTDHAYRWPHVTRDLVWTDPEIFGRATPEGTVVLEHLGWVVDRRRAGGAILAFSARGGHNGEPHNQNDLGHFIVHVAGESLLADLGAGLYTRDYFGPRRYEHIHNSSAGHSVPLIDGHTQRAGAEFRAEVLRCEPHARGVTFALDLTRAYDVPALRRLTRTFAWEFDADRRRAHLTVDDAFAFGDTPAAIEEALISLHEPEIDAAAGRATWRGQRGSVTLTFDPEAYEATCESIDSQDHHARPIVVRRLRLRARHPAAEMSCRMEFACQVS
ncbi:MAG TPA: heparinase II/III family protein [Roseiflexaceae bacterium]|nr:heparinase II/III family protein [Roseiflexaceae bacterium]